MIVQAATHLLTEEIINQQLVVDIREMIYTIIKRWIAELHCTVIIEAQPFVLRPQKHLYKKDLYHLSHLYLRNQAMPNHLLIQIHHYCHLRFILHPGGIKTSPLQDHLTHLLEVVRTLTGLEIKAINPIVQ